MTDTERLMRALRAIAGGHTEMYPDIPHPDIMRMSAEEFRGEMWAWSERVARSVLTQEQEREDHAPLLTPDQVEQAYDDLKKLHGRPPYDTGSNISYNDGYFAQSLIRKYGMRLSELEDYTGYSARMAAYDRKRAELDKEI